MTNLTNDMGPVEELLAILNLERIEVNRFRGFTPASRSIRVFGGQVIAQALVAAYRTVEDRICHSMHAYFIRPGDPTIPILYEVDQARDGRSFTTRRVVAIQNGEQIFNLAASFQVAEDGYEHQMPMPDLVGPENLTSTDDVRKKLAERTDNEKVKQNLSTVGPIDVRPVDPQHIFKPAKMSTENPVWMRLKEKIDDEPYLHHAVLAYASDMTLLDTCVRPHGVNYFTGTVQMASLDHAMWFHEPFRADEWLLFAQDSPSASGGRGFNRGSVFSTDGRLVASIAQEGLIRPVRS